MSKKRSLQRKQEENEMNSPSPNQSVVESRRSTQNLQHQELDMLAGTAIRYLLAKSTEMEPAKASVLKKLLCAGTYPFDAVIKRTREILLRVFGYELISNKAANYFIVNRRSHPEELTEWPMDQCAHHTLLYIVLAFIFMSPETPEHQYVKEDRLMEFLRNLKIITDEENQPNAFFGDVKDLIYKKFVEQLYLTKRKEKDAEICYFEWGVRSENEISRNSILKFVAKIYGREQRSFVSQYAALGRA